VYPCSGWWPTAPTAHSATVDSAQYSGLRYRAGPPVRRRGVTPNLRAVCVRTPVESGRSSAAGAEQRHAHARSVPPAGWAALAGRNRRQPHTATASNRESEPRGAHFRNKPSGAAFYKASGAAIG
jgi:hypothetical protein